MPDVSDVSADLRARKSRFPLSFRLIFLPRDLLPHTRGANGFRDRGHVVQSFSAK